MAEQKFVGLQFLRGFCALGVVLDHADGIAALPQNFGHHFSGGFLHHGHVGVDVFFVISGFIMTIVSLQGPALDARVTVGDFFLRRFTRIIPLMWVAILSYAALKAAVNFEMDSIPPTLRAMFLIPYGSVEPTPIWTLRHEFIFYILFAVTFLGPRAARLCLIAWVLAPLLWAVTAGTLLESGLDYSMKPSQFGGIVLSPVNLEFGAGMLAGYMTLRKPFDMFGGSIHPFWGLLGLIAAVAVLNGLLPIAWMSPAACVMNGILGLGIVLLAACWVCPEGWLTRIGLLLGDASYSIYLFHVHAISVAMVILHRLAPGLPIGVIVLLAFLTGAAAGVIAHLLMERPLVAWAHRRFIGKRSAPVVVQAPAQ